MHVYDCTLFKKIGCNEKFISLIAYYFLPNLCEKNKFLPFFKLDIFWPGESNYFVFCLVTGCHGNSHHPKPHLFLFFLDMLLVDIKI